MSWKGRVKITSVLTASCVVHRPGWFFGVFLLNVGSVCVHMLTCVSVCGGENKVASFLPM